MSEVAVVQVRRTLGTMLLGLLNLGCCGITQIAPTLRVYGVSHLTRPTTGARPEVKRGLLMWSHLLYAQSVGATQCYSRNRLFHAFDKAH